MASSTVDLLPANLQNTLHEIVERVNASGGGIRVILISTAEGVPLGRVYSAADRATPLNEAVLNNIESTWAPAAKQYPLLNMGKEVKVVTAIYGPSKSSTGFVGECLFGSQNHKSVRLTRMQIYGKLSLCFAGAVFHVYQAPVVVTILAGVHANLGAIRSTAIPLLKDVLEPLCTTLLNSLAPANETDHGYPQHGYYQ